MYFVLICILDCTESVLAFLIVPRLSNKWHITYLLHVQCISVYLAASDGILPILFYQSLTLKR